VHEKGIDCDPAIELLGKLVEEFPRLGICDINGHALTEGAGGTGCPISIGT
jgi:hypothetical protein